MNPHLIMGLFALYVFIVSLIRIMGDQEYPRLTGMKKVWGRSRGLTMHFVSNVALPLVFGIVFLTRGVAGFGEGGVEGDPEFHYYALSCSSSARAAHPSLADLVDGLSLTYTGEVGDVTKTAASRNQPSPSRVVSSKAGPSNLPWVSLAP